MQDTKINNIETFSLCVASIMDDLYESFPLPKDIVQPDFFSAYDPNEIMRNGKLMIESDKNYLKFFDEGFSEIVGSRVVAGIDYDEHMNPIKGESYIYYTSEVRREIKNRVSLYDQALEIHRETIGFLKREGYIVQIDKMQRSRYSEKFTLTSKGFAHLNREFKSKTIQSNFQNRILNNANKFLETGNATATFATTLKGAIVALLSNG